MSHIVLMARPTEDKNAPLLTDQAQAEAALGSFPA